MSCPIEREAVLTRHVTKEQTDVRRPANRDFLKELDFTTEELAYLLDLSRDLKQAKHTGTEVQRMAAGTSP